MRKNYCLKFKLLKPASGAARLLFFIGEGRGWKRWIRVLPTGTQKAKKRFLQNIARTRARKFIEVKKTNGKTMAKLTKDGLIEYLKLKLINAEELPDGTVCLVVFDIPEKQKIVRNLLRRFFKEICLFPIQKSVWVSPFDLTDILADFCELLDLDKWVRIFLAREKHSSKFKRSFKF